MTQMHFWIYRCVHFYFQAIFANFHYLNVGLANQFQRFFFDGFINGAGNYVVDGVFIENIGTIS